MFTELFNNVFPLVADFFDNLIALSTLTPNAFLLALEQALEFPDAIPISIALEGTNFWTGLNGLDNIYFDGLMIDMSWAYTTWGRALAILLYPILNFFFAPVITYPLWIALPLTLALWGFVYGVIKFFVGIFV